MTTDRERLEQVVQAQDDAAQAGKMDGYTATVVDPDTLVDFAYQRAGVCLAEMTGQPVFLIQPVIRAAVAAAFQDGFVAGAKFQGQRDV
jgi:hypothetical protein